ncbi:Predicted ATP-binding protein involved in virulence [Actinopolymorpha cephalotaxi]|uniref:Energy-coupling factor transporter ATP-binding protein EcfA2 n=1 Tax=Actinopolymorpha cephalotaxi TaxID=504797 RepID=A0A1I2NN41_9ACTN|nr:AAA family ATPase [Actinopolymorpha cephalotaxi]NYH85427.1 energy-coupling factor transporter ATP-binding protein EcfA2 [Actinopolymorpha cephalotaxi]SFG05405.1 Predicted ATP-binding protein involved in virulence [Actinopolymorpha cephalotaxi]
MSTSGGLRLIVVRGLFGFRDYELNIDPEYPTVLTGANGTGKSTLLQLVNAVSTGDVRVLADAPVDRLELHFESKPTFRLVRDAKGSVHLSWGDHSSDLKPLPSFIKDIPEWMRREILEDGEFSATAMRRLNLALATRSDVSPRLIRDIRRYLAGAKFEQPDWLAGMGEEFPVLFVTDQRLVVDTERTAESHGAQRKAERSFRRAVEAASDEIADMIRRVDTAYARVSQQQDRAFPRRVITAMRSSRRASVDYLRRQLLEVDRKRFDLREVGLLDIDQPEESELVEASLEDPNVRPVIATFLTSSLRKFEVLEGLYVRLRAFKDFLDERFTPKKLLIDRGAGLRFELPSGEPISPSQLSSGEQQMMVLAYEILFRAEKGTLVLIDEPEISLHVLWQDSLIQDLTNMGRASDLQFLMATHSPVLLASHPETERSLDLDANAFLS